MANQELGPAGSPGLRALAEVRWNVDDLSRAMVDYAAALGKDLSVVVASAALALVSRIKLRTPVRTGRARASWHAVLEGRTDDYTYEDDLGRSFDGAVSAPAPAPGQALIASNLRYMLALEAGWSKQAPQGMVRVSVEEFRGAFRAQVLAALRKGGKLP